MKSIIQNRYKTELVENLPPKKEDEKRDNSESLSKVTTVKTTTPNMKNAGTTTTVSLVDENTTAQTKLKQFTKSSFVSSTSSEKPSDLEEVEVDYDADDDDDYEDEVEKDYEIVIDGNSRKPPLESNKKMRKVKSTPAVSSQQTAAANGNEKAPDSTSSSESGFGTVDDEIDPNTGAPVVVKLDPGRKPSSTPDHQGVILDMAALGKKCVDTSASSAAYPILQPPKQVIYELGVGGDGKRRRASDNEIVNILNHRSLDSSICDDDDSSSSSSANHKNCCVRFFSRLVKFFYSCFFCYSSTPQDKPLFCCTWLSIFCCCCPLLAGVSLYLTKRSNRFKRKQKYELADKYSGWAEKLNIASLIIGIIFYAIAFFMITLVIFMYWRPHNS